MSSCSGSRPTQRFRPDFWCWHDGRRWWWRPPRRPRPRQLPTPTAATQPRKGQQKEEPVDLNKMQGDIPPELIETKECKRLLQKIGFSLVAAQSIVCNHGYDTATKLSHLKPDNINILCKTLHLSGRERQDGTRDPGINFPHLAQHTLTSTCFVLYHQEHCNLHPMINIVTPNNVYDLDLQCARETEHNNNLYQKNRPKWNEKDPKRSLINICEYFETFCRTNKAPCLYMLHQHIIPLGTKTGPGIFWFWQVDDQTKPHHPYQAAWHLCQWAGHWVTQGLTSH